MLGGSLWTSASGRHVSVHTSVDLTAVFCAARVIAEGIAQMPVRIVADTYTDGQSLPVSVPVRDHWARQLLGVRPNEWQTAYEFREGMIFCAALAGASLAIKNVVRGEVRELLPVPPGCWSVEQMADWSVRFRIDYADKTHGYFDRASVFYVRGPSLDGFSGISAVRAARQAIGLSQALEEQQARVAGGAGIPSGILSFPDMLKPETKEKLKATWQEKFGPGGSGGIALLDQDAKFLQMTMTSVDSQYIETRRMQIEEIARAFRVQPIMLMQADKAATFASAEQMFRNHVIHTLGPWIERFEHSANADILNHDPSLRVDLDERNLLRGDFKDQAEYYAKALGAGGTPAWMTQDEIRFEVGLPPMGGSASVLSAGAMGGGASEAAAAEEGMQDDGQS